MNPKARTILIRFGPFALAGALCLGASSAGATNGHMLHGVGPINQSLGGAGAAAGTDLFSSVIWNPATLTRAADDGITVEVSAEYFIPDRTLESSVDANSFGPGIPAIDFSGKTKSKTNAEVLPNIAVSYRPKDAPWTAVVAVTSIGGFGVDYRGEAAVPGANPIVTPQPSQGGLGFGRLRSDLQIAKLSGGGAWQVTDRISVGLTGVIALTRLRVQPAPFAAPDDADGSGFATYPLADDFENAWGGGFRLGITYRALDNLELGFGIASPIWFEDLEWKVEDELGANRNIELALDVPLYLAAGIAWRPIEPTLLVFDVHWFDYEHTDGFKKEGFRADGSIRGFGWKSIVAVAIGVEHRLLQHTLVRAGYNWGENPIPDSLSFFNTVSPAIVQHHLSAGVTQELPWAVDLHITFYHAFKESIEGPYQSPVGAVPGTSVKSSLSETSISFGVTARF